MSKCHTLLEITCQSARMIYVLPVQSNKSERTTPGRRESKTLFTIDKHGLKIDRNSVFDCHLSPAGQQMTIENSVLNDFGSTFVYSIDVFDCHLSGVRTA